MARLVGDIVTFYYDATGIFGVAILLVVLSAFLITLPFEVLKEKQMKKQKAIAPEISEIRKKYGGSAMGVSADVSMIEDEDIKKMSVDERDEKMKKEISEVRIKARYRPVLLWIPMVLTLIFVVCLHSGISIATPDGFYGLTLVKIKNNLSDNLLSFFFILSPVLMSVVESLFDYFKAGFGDSENKPSVMSAVASGLLSMSLMVWIACNATVAISIALASFQVLKLLKDCFFNPRMHPYLYP